MIGVRAASGRLSPVNEAGGMDLSMRPHRRRNPLTGEWVLVSPQRTERPWQGQTAIERPSTPRYDPECYLCPGNARSGGVMNPDYASTFVFQNDFAALLADAHPRDVTPDARVADLFRAATVDGECRVICFSPRHDLTLARMNATEIAVVIDLWRQQITELRDAYEWVQIFETRGAISGASNPHPHGQIWASSYLPDEAVKELAAQTEYKARHGRHLLVDYVEREIELGERVVVANQHWAVIVPYWAYWPYETMVLPRRDVACLTDLSIGECEALGDVLRSMLAGFDDLFDTEFPYCSGWHGAPRTASDGWQLHAHYYPPLLRSADIAKIPASYELLANRQRDLTAEFAAERLRMVVAARS
jgi:UDPglucose--hexose-1-phosphate uridylyltransferase